jgi:TCP-1/cpn60 chaperonin family
VRQIAEKSGVEGSVVVGKLTDKDEPNYGYDAQSGENKDMVAAGIIDPTKVVRVALQDAPPSSAPAAQRRARGGRPLRRARGWPSCGRSGIVAFNDRMSRS